MRLIFRPIAPGEINHELLWLAVSTGAITLGACWFALHLPWPVCSFHAITGHPCPTCGATRTAMAFLHGNFVAAWRWNPLAFTAYFALAIFNVYALIAVVTGAPRLRIVQIAPLEKKSIAATVAALVFVNWIYLLMANPRL